MSQDHKKEIRGLIGRSVLAGVVGMAAAGLTVFLLDELFGGDSSSAVTSTVLVVPWLVVLFLMVPVAYRRGLAAGKGGTTGEADPT